MTFIPTISPDSALQPDYQGSQKVERWTATAAAGDAGVGTIASRYIQNITDVNIQFFNGTGPSTYSFVGGTLLMQLPGTTTATLWRITLYGRYS